MPRSSAPLAVAASPPPRKVRVVTAAALFDGHDASISIMRRMLQSAGAEVIHLGHNRSVDDIVTAALHEDADAIAVSSYQGGHVEFFEYMLDLLRTRGGERIRVFGGGGGVITPDEAAQLQAYGVARIFSPEDGQRLGLQGIIDEVLGQCSATTEGAPPDLAALGQQDLDARLTALARWISALESERVEHVSLQALREKAASVRVPVLGITGTGGSGKSSLTDELVRRLRLDQDDRLHIAVISIDPSRKRSGGALLGDRIRMNAIGPWQHGSRVYMRSLATRDTGTELSRGLPDILHACRCAGFDLILVETSGVGQGDTAIVPLVDTSLYVMTPEYGAASQLEKIDMLDFADFVAVNKFDRRGAPDALRDVAKQVQRNRGDFGTPPDAMPVFGTTASRFNDLGVTALYQALRGRLKELGLRVSPGRLPPAPDKHSPHASPIIPARRSRYLAEAAEAVRGYKARARQQATLARSAQQLRAAQRMLRDERGVAPDELEELAATKDAQLSPDSRTLLESWPELQSHYRVELGAGGAPDEAESPPRYRTTLAGTRVPRVALPHFEDRGALLHWLLLENVPGRFPFTAGVFPFKREGEDPTRMFAGEGDPFRTNRRFKLLSEGMPAKRLSTAFDSVTLYGSDPDLRPDIYGKVGNSGVSIATLDDMAALYDGIDLTDPSTSVSMTINGPAPAVLAMFLNVAIDQRREFLESELGRGLTHEEAREARRWVLSRVRGTVQADILKEDQGQNTCLFSTEFSLQVMGDVQAWFVEHGVRNFYSVSISGYHIAEAGANPITQLAFTLANAFTYVEAYLARGMHIDDFAPNLSFFFSNGMDAEYAVLGRVARRIWAVAMRDLYGASERGQKLKYHCQTSGRSLHAQEIAFNDIRTTLQALIATYDQANSLHTNAYDEAITTPTEQSVRRAMAIQLVINREWGLAKNENPNQGSFVVDELTELVEEAVLKELEALSERGGVLGAMELGYQRGKIQDESLHYEHLKHNGQLPIVGVNTFRGPDNDQQAASQPLARSTEDEKQGQLSRLRAFHARHADRSPGELERLKAAVVAGENVFDVLMDTVRTCSLGQITEALFEVGGQFRRNT